jgi:hypothetical protein
MVRGTSKASVSADHLAPRGGGYEPQRSYAWQIELPVGGTVLKMAASSVTGVTETNEPIELHYGNEVRFVAGKARFDSMQVVVRDMVDENVAQIIDNWRRTVYDPRTGKVNKATAYKAEGDLILMDTTGVERARYHLIGVWPSSVNFGDLDYESNDLCRIQVVMTIDKADKIS